MIVVTRTDTGKVRRNNQDTAINLDRLYGVADGMGGHKGGETASAGARDALKNLLRNKKPASETLRMAIEAANRRLFLRQQDDESLSGMGTTLTVLWLGGKESFLGHVGDSRAYLMREGEMKQITRDHSLVQELVEQGLLTPEQAAHHPMRNIITRAVGTEEGVAVDVITTERKKDDLWLICSDGLYGMVSDEEIARILKEHGPDEAADLLMAAALEAGGRDNVTFVILKDEEGGE